ncbi:MAG: LuxR C-terminal-related transcriptional regulator [Cyanobacteriota bacterium]|nr:LuxR C-terminal-related transcriptional regulator [Cyanobacteriota bacterium]
MDLLSAVGAQRRAALLATGWRMGGEVRPGIGLAAASGLVLLGLRALVAPRRELAFMVTTEEEALRGLRLATPGLLITTPQLAGGSGLSLLRRVKSSGADTRTILLVDHGVGDLDPSTAAVADGALLEEECFDDGASLAALTRALSRGQGFRSPALLARWEAATLSLAPGRGGLPSLNRRELELVDLLVRGLGDRQIAEHLAIPYETARGRTKALRRRLGVSSRAELVAKALRLGLSR